MAKLARNTYPAGSTADDFKCYGPPATKDTEFSTARIADMGCFTQDGKDSNKFYHVCMCTHKTTNQWYVFVQYGRVGATNLQFQWIECGSEAAARNEFEDKCDEKNTKRGQWTTVGGMNMFTPKEGKDLYCVRQLAKRSHGLPDAQNITVTEAVAPKPKTTSTKSNRCPKTVSLWRDLAAREYTKCAHERAALVWWARVGGGAEPSRLPFGKIAADLVAEAWWYYFLYPHHSSGWYNADSIGY